jgi:hypothetical protein
MRDSERAACRNHDPRLWYPQIIDANGDEWFDDGTIWEAFGDTSEFYAPAKAICDSCPVRTECREQGLANKERWGMWGGLTPIERRRIERKERRQRLKERRAEEADDD